LYTEESDLTKLDFNYIKDNQVHCETLDFIKRIRIFGVSLTEISS